MTIEVRASADLFASCTVSAAGCDEMICAHACTFNKICCPLYVALATTAMVWDLNIGALIIRIGFWVPLYYKSNREPPK